MSLIHRMSEPVRTPVQRFTNHYAIFFEDLIHAVKNEIVSKVEHVDRRVEDHDRSMIAAYEAISDQLAIQTSTIRTLVHEVARLQKLVEQGATTGSVLDLDTADSSADSDQVPVAKGATRSAEG